MFKGQSRDTFYGAERLYKKQGGVRDQQFGYKKE